jgi:hypothetical protein
MCRRGAPREVLLPDPVGVLEQLGHAFAAALCASDQSPQRFDRRRNFVERMGISVDQNLGVHEY